MPRLFNAENCKFKTFAVASLASNTYGTATFTGLTTNDYVKAMTGATTNETVDAYVQAANTIRFYPVCAVGTQSTVAQTVGVVAMVAPTSGENGGSW